MSAAEQSPEKAPIRIGELFAGYGGLGMGVQAAIGGQIAWFSEFDASPSRILAHRFPGVPNHGDITAIDWSQVEPVDVLTGGSPCQDLSHAGARKGMTEGTRSNLWVAMREAIAQLRPGLVVWENVRGAYSAAADSDLEPCAGCVGDRPGMSLRALGRVLGDLSDLGYDCRWHGLRAADVGAPHGRFRVFVVATDTTRNAGRIGNRDGLSAADAGCLRRREGWTTGPGEAEGGRTLGDVAGRGLLPTPTTRDHKGHNQRRDDTCLTGALLPTPSVADGAGGHERRGGARGNELLLNGVAKELALLPTPTSQAAKHSGGDADRGPGSPDDANLWIIAQRGRWGDYAPAIARWERHLGRPAPAPTMTSSKGNPQLAPRFVEWMMGLPEGWVDDAPGLTRNEKLKALGNGVVSQQCAEALRVMAAWEVAA